MSTSVGRFVDQNGKINYDPGNERIKKARKSIVFFSLLSVGHFGFVIFGYFLLSFVFFTFDIIVRILYYLLLFFVFFSVGITFRISQNLNIIEAIFFEATSKLKI